MLKILLLVLALLVVAGLLFAIWNHYDVQARDNGPDYNPDVPVLRTPDDAFAGLDDFPFEPFHC